jgi:small GTP-binding protein
MSYDYLFKIIVIGKAYVGKTSVVSGLINREVSQQYQNTIGVDFSVKNLELENHKKIKLQLWDTAGQESFHSIIKSYYRYVSGVVIVFDVTDRESFQKIDYWLHQYNKENECNKEHKENRHKHPILLLGNKCDVKTIKRVVTEKEATRKAEDIGAIYYETSAYANLHIQESFQALSEKIYDQMIHKITLPFCKGIRLGPLQEVQYQYKKRKQGNNYDKDRICFYNDDYSYSLYTNIKDCCSIM